MTKKITLVNVPWKIKGKKDVDEVSFKFSPPMGLAYLASTLRKEGYKVEIIDALALGWKDRVYEKGYINYGVNMNKLISLVLNSKPDLVGLSCLFTTQYPNNLEFAKKIKKLKKNLPIVIGGAHASALPEETIKEDCFDYLIKGEGEEIFVDLIKNIDKSKKEISKIKGIYYKKGNEIYFTGKRRPILPLDKIPFPAYDLLNLNEYFQAWKQSGRTVYNKKWSSIFTSRGCPYKCVFCSIHPVYGRGWRGFSPERVVEEIEYLYNTYHIKEFLFEDDNLTFNKDRAKRIFKLLLKKGLDKNKICWTSPNGLRADTIDEELMSLFKKTGARYIRIACESGDQNIVDNIIHKNIDIREIERVAKLAKKWKIPLGIFFVIGFPGEKISNINKTINYAKHLFKAYGADPLIFYACPLPGTELYPICEVNNYFIMEPTPENYMKAIWVPEGVEPVPMIQTEDFSAKDLIKIMKKYKQWEKFQRFKKNPLRESANKLLVSFQNFTKRIRYNLFS